MAVVVTAGAVAHRVVMLHAGAVAVRASVVARVAYWIRALDIVARVAGSVMTMISNALSVARIVSVLLVRVAVAMAMAMTITSVARASVTVATVAVTIVAIVVVAHGSRWRVLTNNAAGLNGESSLKVGGVIGEFVFNLVCVSIRCLLENFQTTAHDGGWARKVDQDVVLDVAAISGGNTLLTDSPGVSICLLDSCDNLDSAALRILEWVRATVLVLLSERSPLFAHLIALLGFITGVLEHQNVVGDVRSFACRDHVSEFSEDRLIVCSSLVVSWICKIRVSYVGEPFHSGRFAWCLSELVEPLSLGSVIVCCITGIVGHRRLSLDTSGVATSELSLF